MSRFRLTYWRRRRLLGQLKTTAEARTYRRTSAVPELDRGRPPAAVAEMRGEARQGVYNWPPRSPASAPRVLWPTTPGADARAS